MERPEVVDEKPRGAEPPPDDGYETSNSGEPRAKPSPPPPSPYAPAYPPYPYYHEPYLHYQQHKYNGIKRECDDPYSFVEEDMSGGMLQPPPPPPPQHPHMAHPAHHHHLMLNQPKKRGRKKKIKDENGMEIKAEMVGPDGVMIPRPVKERKKHDRFNGMSEEEVARRTLPDHLTENLDIIIIGINPGLFAAYKGHHYAGPGNHFWKCLYLSGLTREQMSADEDYKLLSSGIGFTNMVPRPTKGSADLTRREIKEGSAVLLEKLRTFKPKVAVFNGKLIYEVFSGKKDFCFGKQPDTVTGTSTYMWVMPSSSARCAQLPRAADKVPFYAALKKFRDYLNGLVPHVDESELVFPDTTSRRPQDELEIRRLTQEPDPAETILLEDGTEVPLKKKRGRPKKVRADGEPAPPRAPRAPRQPARPVDPDQPLKKKRGRPKKIRPEEQQFLMQQQALLPHQQTSQPQPPPAHDNHYMHQEGQFGGTMSENVGNNSMMYPQQHADNDNYYQPPQTGELCNVGGVGAVGAPLEGSLDLGLPRYDTPAQYLEPRPLYSPRAVQFGRSATPISGGQFAEHQFALYSRSPGSPAASYQASPAAASYQSPAAASYQSPAYSAHSSPAPPTRTPGYNSPHHYATQQSGAGGALCGELGGGLSPSSPAPALDFDPPSPASPSPAPVSQPATPAAHHLDDYHKSSSVGSEMSVGGGSAAGYGFDNDVYRRDSDVYRYNDQGGGNGGVDSPQLEQLHQHVNQHVYGNNYNRETPPVGGSGGGTPEPFTHAAFRPPEQHPGSPTYPPPSRTPSQPGGGGGGTGGGGGGGTGSKPDVSAKSLSGLESLVDQIPSIAEGEPTAPPPAPAPLDYTTPLYPHYPPYPAPPPAYANNGYVGGGSFGAGVVGYGAGWGGQVLRPAAGYLPDWQYGYAPPYAPYNAPYYPQQYLPPAPLLDLHKAPHTEPQPPAAVPFSPFC